MLWSSGVDSRRLRPQGARADPATSPRTKGLPEWMTGWTQLMRFCRPFYPNWDRGLEAKPMRQVRAAPDRKTKHLSAAW